jgi:capsid protein
MADKRFPYSLVRGIQNTIAHGSPAIGPEMEFHAQAIRDVNRDPLGIAKSLHLDTAKTHSFYAPLEVFMRRDLSAGVVGSGAEFIPQLARGRSDLLTWSAVVRAGAIVIDGLSGNETLWQVSQLPAPEWIAEVGQVIPTTVVFGAPPLAKPKRLSATVLVSKMLLEQAGPNPPLENLLIADLSRQLGAYVDQVALLGTGPVNNQPTGVKAWAGVPQIPTAAPTWGLFTQTEATIETQNVSMDSYGIICSPAVREELRTTPIEPGYPRFIWDATIGLSSNQLSGTNATTVFFGAWQMLSILIWGSVEILVNPFTYADTNRVLISATILADVAVRLPAAFSWITLE